eukprot:sb/3472432/
MSDDHCKKKKKKLVLSTMAADFPLTTEEKAAIKSTYDIFATTSGRLDGEKIATVLRLIGGAPTEDELAGISLHFPHDSYLCFEDFVELVENHRKSHGFMAEELREAFAVFDIDGDGEIDTTELVDILTQVGDPLSHSEAEQLVRESDLDGDGKINYVEFVAMTVRP